MSLTLALAEKAIDAAKAFAMERRFPPVNIAVVDCAAHAVAFARMDGAMLGGIDVATKKARTSALFRQNSGVLAPLIAPGAPVYTIENSNGGLIGFAGGVLMRDMQGQIIGAIGVSGASVDEDELVAQAAAAVTMV